MLWEEGDHKQAKKEGHKMQAVVCKEARGIVGKRLQIRSKTFPRCVAVGGFCGTRCALPNLRFCVPGALCFLQLTPVFFRELPHGLWSHKSRDGLLSLEEADGLTDWGRKKKFQIDPWTVVTLGSQPVPQRCLCWKFGPPYSSVWVEAT